DNRCYKCGARQSESAAPIPGEGPGLRLESAIANRSVRAYQSSVPFALIASLLIVALAALGVVILVANLGTEQAVKDQITAILNGAPYDPNRVAAQLDPAAGAELARLAVLVAAVIAFGAWLSRVVGNIPVLGGGLPSRSPLRVFIYTLIPIWNLIKVPGILQDALYRVEPSAGGFFMVAAAWFGLVGSWIVSFVGGWVIGVGLVNGLFNAPSREAAGQALQRSIDQSFALDAVTSAMVVIGALILVLLIVRVERRCAARDAEVRATVLGSADA
ncbi:MAG TPA: DUF4328 domain-containing protein, partial [Candidatus Limnocylindrales bacterium]|nr:DUF4328 domain-containing protein [Candidatus Limnocylindrales bacterium]